MFKDTFYFSHDYNARNNSKIKKLLCKHGYLGYGLFWAIIEELYNNANALPTDYDSIAFDLRTTAKLVKSIVNDFDFFVFEGEKFGSLSIQERLDVRNKKSISARESANKRWNKDANALQPNSERNANLQKSDAIKERKGKEKEEEKGGGDKIFVPPSMDEVKKYFKENGYSEIAAQKAFKYYETANWHDSKNNPVKNWKQKMQGVWFKDENKNHGLKLNLTQTEKHKEFADQIRERAKQNGEV